jgi:hypothetical protein
MAFYVNIFMKNIINSSLIFKQFFLFLDNSSSIFPFPHSPGFSLYIASRIPLRRSHSSSFQGFPLVKGPRFSTYAGYSIHAASRGFHSCSHQGFRLT